MITKKDGVNIASGTDGDAMMSACICLMYAVFVELGICNVDDDENSNKLMIKLISELDRKSQETTDELKCITTKVIAKEFAAVILEHFNLLESKDCAKCKLIHKCLHEVSALNNRQIH